MSTSDRKPINIRFRYNKGSGVIEDFIIDDNAPDATEDYSDHVARLIADKLGAKAVILDAGVASQRMSSPREMPAASELRSADSELRSADSELRSQE